VAGRSVLVVDDDASLRDAMSRALRARGYAVNEAVDGKQALRMLQADPPDVIVTDVLMPNRDGIELLTGAKTSHPAVRILVITGRRRIGELDLLELAVGLGADETLAKPFSTDDLIAKVERLAGPAAASNRPAS
jgi:two-component system response regulator MprA